jgi:coniferyl-aldehyde dehydrogenase
MLTQSKASSSSGPLSSDIHALADTPAQHDPQEMAAVFELQKAAFQSASFASYQTRMNNLKKLYKVIDENSETLSEALNKDFGCRSKSESEVAEIIGCLSSIRYLMKNLKSFMKPKKRATSIWFLPAKNQVILQPLGVIGVMAPWNYSLHLTIAPMAAALAAGNTVMAKMSELTPHTCATLKTLLERHFKQDTVAVFGGEVAAAQQFSNLPFNHLLFTGSTAVGKMIAKAAANNLTPVTLELSGKSPVVIGKDYDVTEAAKRIMWGKTFNAGQTCVAPDYVLLPKEKLLEFVRAARAAVNQYYPQGIDHCDYTSVINHQHYLRLNNLLDDAEQQGIEVLPLAEPIHKDNKVAPTLVLQPNDQCKIYNDELFGPLLPIFTYDNLDHAIEQIKPHSDPLALYVFSQHQDERNYIAQRISAGSVAINDTLLQYIQNDLPFGGVGNSGLGKYHGIEGFQTFSNSQAQFIQRGLGKFTSIKLLYPPYTGFSRFMMKLLRLLP